MKYLLDTSICVFLFRDMYKISEKIDKVGLENCAISEITKAELLTGLYLSQKKRQAPRQEKEVMKFLDCIDIIPISNAIEQYAAQKAALLSLGKPIEDFDLLIGCSAVTSNYIMVTDNTSHFNRINGIILENWVTR